MTQELKKLREALRRVKYEAASLADAQVIAIEALSALQSAQPAEVSEEQIVAALEAAGVKFQRFMGGISGTKDCWSTAGSQDARKLTAGVRAILALRPQADTLCFYLSTMLACPPSDSDVVAAVESLIPLRPQAVPMTDEQVDRIWNALPMGNGFWLSFARAVEAHHGIAAQEKGDAHQATKESSK